jgi:hypothetical protein
VIDDQMDVQILRHGFLDLAQEAQKLLVPLALLARGDHFPGRQVQGGQSGGGAVADEVVGDTLHVAQAQPLRGSQGLRQQRLGSIQRLDLRLLVGAEHHRLVRWIEEQADDVADLLNEEGIGRELAVGTYQGSCPLGVLS